MKTVLLIAYHFPPSTEVGGIRVANFAKGLSVIGWKPIILTVKDKYVEKIDIGRMKGIESIRIVKAGRTYKLTNLYFLLKKMWYVLLGNPDPDSRKTRYSDARVDISERESFSMRIKRYYRAFINLPDTESNWIIPASYKAIRELRNSKIDCILTSCPPYSCHLVGLIVKTVSGASWIADFRDPWRKGEKFGVFPTCGLSLAIDRWMEKRVIRRADIVLANTKAMVADFTTRFRAVGAEKFIYLPNMIDKELYRGFRHFQKYPEFTISYAGTLYLGRSPEPLMRAIQELTAEKRITGDGIRLKLLGDCASVNGTSISNIIERYGLEKTVEVPGQVPYATALEIIRKSHLGLLLAPEQPLQIPAKVYEYMGLGTNILALAKDGATKDFLNATGCGRAFDPSDITGIKEFLLERMALQEQGDMEDFRGSTDAFEVSTVVEKLSCELDKLCGRKI